MVHPIAVLGHLHLYPLAMAQGVVPGQLDLPSAVFQPGQGMALPIPAVKVADQMQGVRPRRPLPVYPAILGTMEAVVQVAGGHRRKVSLAAQKYPPDLGEAVHAQLNILLKGRQPRVYTEDLIRPLLGFPFHVHPSGPIL